METLKDKLISRDWQPDGHNLNNKDYSQDHTPRQIANGPPMCTGIGRVALHNTAYSSCDIGIGYGEQDIWPMVTIRR